MYMSFKICGMIFVNILFCSKISEIFGNTILYACLELLDDGWILVVEIGLFSVELMEIELLPRFAPSPTRAAENAQLQENSQFANPH